MEETEKWSSYPIYTVAGQQGNVWRSHSWKGPGWLLGVARTATDFGNGWLTGGSYSECGGGRRQEWKPRLTHCLKGREFPRIGGSPSKEGWNSRDGGSWEQGSPGMYPDPLAGRHSRSTCTSLCSMTACTRLMGFCLIVGEIWSTARKVLFHRETCANTCSLCNAYATTLTLSCFAVMYNSASLLFLPRYFGKKSLFWGKKERDKKAIL